MGILSIVILILWVSLIIYSTGELWIHPREFLRKRREINDRKYQLIFGDGPNPFTGFWVNYPGVELWFRRVGTVIIYLFIAWMLISILTGHFAGWMDGIGILILIWFIPNLIWTLLAKRRSK